MNKHEATLYFAKELNKRGHIKIVYSPLVQGRLEKIAKSFELTDEPNSSVYTNMMAQRGGGSSVYFNVPLKRDSEGVPHFCEDHNPISDFGGREIRWRDYLLIAKDALKARAERDLKSQTTEGDYIFINDFQESIDWGNELVFAYYSGTALAIITERELSFLKEFYKGDLRGEVLEAAQVLDIQEALDVKYKELAENNPSKFCGYFKAVSKEKRLSILDDIWGLIDQSKLDNKIKLLLREDKYKDLALEVGRGKLK